MKGGTTQPGPLAVYVTSHGFGHLNRTVAVLNQVPVDVPMVIRSPSRPVPHWRERLMRPADFEPHVSDAGAVNPPEDSGATDAAATLERAARVHAEAMTRLDDDVDSLRDADAGAVLCDAPPLPLTAARRAGVPGYLLCNFTWYDIYAALCAVGGTRGEAPGRRVSRTPIARPRASFDASQRCKMSWLPNQIDVGLVANPGRDRSRELRKLLGLGTTEKLVYFYIGRYGQDDLDWDRLASYAGAGCISSAITRLRRVRRPICIWSRRANGRGAT